MMSQSGYLPIERGIGTIRLAAEFLAAARQQDLEQTPPSMVTYFLLGHALELAFKSVLIAHGSTDAALRKLSHDLTASRNAACEAAPSGPVVLSVDDTDQLELLTPFYRAKALEYVQPGFRRLPIPAKLTELTERLVGKISPYVDSRVRASLRERRAV